MFQLCSGEASVLEVSFEVRLIIAILVAKVGTALGVGEVFVVRVCGAPGDGEVLVVRVITGRGVDVERSDISLVGVKVIGQVLVIRVMGVRGVDFWCLDINIAEVRIADQILGTLIITVRGVDVRRSLGIVSGHVTFDFVGGLFSDVRTSEYELRWVVDFPSRNAPLNWQRPPAFDTGHHYCLTVLGYQVPFIDSRGN